MNEGVILFRVGKTLATLERDRFLEGVCPDCVRSTEKYGGPVEGCDHKAAEADLEAQLVEELASGDPL